MQLPTNHQRARARREQGKQRAVRGAAPNSNAYGCRVHKSSSWVSTSLSIPPFLFLLFVFLLPSLLLFFDDWLAIVS